MNKLIIPIVMLIILCVCLLCLYKPFNKELKINDDNVIVDNLVAKTYEDILSFLESKEECMLVIGRKGCHYCDIYKPVLESASNIYKFEYMYVDVLELSESDRGLLLNSDIVVPGKCRSEGIDGYLKDGFGTPLTLFIQNKTSYNCIRGYVDEYNLVNVLKEISFIN